MVADADQVKQLIGVVPQDVALYPTLSGRDNLRFFGEMYGLRGKALRQQLGDVLEGVSMAERADDAVITLSCRLARCASLLQSCPPG